MALSLFMSPAFGGTKNPPGDKGETKTPHRRAGHENTHSRKKLKNQRL